MMTNPLVTTNPIDVLVVDDSALVRQSITDILTAHGGFRVRVAHDALFALDKLRQSKPDVILLDLEMPRMDGLTFLQKLMAESPLPVVICSGGAARGSEAAMRALEEGAVDIVEKPKLGVREFFRESQELLVNVIRGAAEARLRRRASSPPRPEPLPHAHEGTKVIAIGASTGGTVALRTFLERMPRNCPPVVVVQHMPAGFTKAFAEQLDRACTIDVTEAVDGDPLVRGHAYIAPGSLHMVVTHEGRDWRLRVSAGPLVSRHRPSVDVLFRSVAGTVGASAVGVIMTGMGDDGAAGLLEMRRAGAMTLAQDEATSVVFGMPREAIRRDAALKVLPLTALPAEALRARR